MAQWWLICKTGIEPSNIIILIVINEKSFSYILTLSRDNILTKSYQSKNLVIGQSKWSVNPRIEFITQTFMLYIPPRTLSDFWYGLRLDTAHCSLPIPSVLTLNTFLFDAQNFITLHEKLQEFHFFVDWHDSPSSTTTGSTPIHPIWP